MVGESFETSPENIDNPVSDNSAEVVQGTENQTREVEPQKLKAIYEKCTKKPDDKIHSVPLFDEHVRLKEEELAEVRTLRDQSQRQLEDLTKAEPLWGKFTSLEKEGVDKGVLMTKYITKDMGRPDYLIEDPNARDITKIRTETGLAAIKAPTRIVNLVRQRQNLVGLEAGFDQIRGTNADGFGEAIKEIYGFYKDNK